MRFAIFILAVAALLRSCNTPTHSYTATWNYDCSANGVPTSFEFGVYNTVVYQPVQILPVKSCSGNTRFSLSGSSTGTVIPGDTFYVRAVYPNNVVSPAAFYP